MEYFFRELTLNDLNAIFTICKDIWKDENGVSEDYLPKIIKKWIQEDNNIVFGVFTDKRKSNLIGLSRIKWLSKDLAWMEGGRVAENYQRKGIGELLATHCVNYARKKKAKVLQYDTWTENEGSLSIAKKLGFQRKTCMELLQSKLKELSLNKGRFHQTIELSPEDAFKYLKEIPNGPISEFCAGWSYKPFNLFQVSKIEGKWIRNKGSILLSIGSSASMEGETPNNNEIWLIVYGNISTVKNLLEGVLIQEKELNIAKEIWVFCPSSLSPPIRSLGFSYFEGRPSGVILFENKLN